MANAKMVDDTTALVTWPVDVWFNGSRTFQASLDFGARRSTTITLDPACRFPDREPGRQRLAEVRLAQLPIIKQIQESGFGFGKNL